MCFKKLNKSFEKLCRKLNWYDISIIKLSTFVFAILICQYFSFFLNVNSIFYIVLIIICLIYLYWKMFFKK